MPDNASALLVALPDRRRRIAEVLAPQGVEVTGEAAGPETALRLLDERAPALLVVELGAETDDPDVLLRNELLLEFVGDARDRVEGLRVIAVAESGNSGLAADALTHGVDAYVVVPDAR